MRRAAVWVAFAALAALPAPGYYHFVHYLKTGSAPEKFDLTVLPTGTVTFFVSSAGPAVLASGDTFASVLSQIRQAAATWNSVASSDLRVGFGGLENTATLQGTPGGDVVFEDLPPGLYGYGGPTSNATPVVPATGSPFIPIVRSTIHLNRNLTLQPGPSYRESFFMTVVHEMGHALGLQHTFTSSTMSQATTRATTLSHPLDADDVAGISVLYPNAAFAHMGSIQGRITSNGRPVHLASVVAIRSGSGAVSALTNADGSFRIDGIPPGQYFVYAHALPPDADIRGPWNSNGDVVPGSAPTDSLFFPGTADPRQASAISVQDGKLAADIDIALNSRSSLPIYDTQVYGYFNNYTIAARPAYVNMLGKNWTVVASGLGLGSNGQAPGLDVRIFGGSAYVKGDGIRPYSAGGYTYIALDLGFSLAVEPGPNHVVFNTPGFMHVLPSGVILTRGDPPTVGSITTQADGTVTVTGTNWTADSQIYFDGAPATITSMDLKAGSAVIVPPPGGDRQTSTLTVYNADGQSSQLVQSATAITYTYDHAATPLISSVSPSALPAGSEAMIDIRTTNLNLVDGLTTVGFGTSDIAVRRVFVLAPDHLRVNVAIAAGATLSNPDITVISGFQLASAPAAFHIQPAIAGLPVPYPVPTNALPGLNGVYAGGIVSVYGTNLSTAGHTTTVSFDGKPATVLYASPTQLNLRMPAELPAGFAVMSLNNGTLDGFPLEVSIDRQPASIGAIQQNDGSYLDATHPARPGDVLIVSLNNFAPSKNQIDLERLKILVGGTAQKVVQANSPVEGVWQLTFVLNTDQSIADAQTLIVYLDGRSSYPANLSVIE